jgi:hypothetical protein
MAVTLWSFPPITVNGFGFVKIANAVEVSRKFIETV